MMPMFARLAFLILFSLLTAAVPAAMAANDPADMLADPAQEARARSIGQELRCLTCMGQSIEDSNSDVAADLRRAVRAQIAAGATDEQTRNWVTDRYGDMVRLRPRFTAVTAMLWIVPMLALLGAIAAILLLRRRRPEPAAPLSAEERARLTEILKE